MCLILFSYKQHPQYTLILAANRDEFYDRPTARAAAWPGQERIVGGRDLRAGGTWMAIDDTQRYGMVTNYRDPASERSRPLSRGNVVTDYLANEESPEAYLERIKSDAERYNGYNTLLGDADALWYYSNREGRIRRLEPGLYGLSNHLLDTPWPKVVRGKRLLESVLNQPAWDQEALFDLLRDDRKAPDQDLPDTGVPLEWERTLSAMFIRSEGYGTRCSTVLTVDHAGQMAFYERTYPTDESPSETVFFTR